MEKSSSDTNPQVLDITRMAVLVQVLDMAIHLDMVGKEILDQAMAMEEVHILEQDLIET